MQSKWAEFELIKSIHRKPDFHTGRAMGTTNINICTASPYMNLLSHVNNIVQNIIRSIG